MGLRTRPRGNDSQRKGGRRKARWQHPRKLRVLPRRRNREKRVGIAPLPATKKTHTFFRLDGCGRHRRLLLLIRAGINSHHLEYYVQLRVRHFQPHGVPGAHVDVAHYRKVGRAPVILPVLRAWSVKNTRKGNIYIYKRTQEGVIGRQRQPDVLASASTPRCKCLTGGAIKSPPRGCVRSCTKPPSRPPKCGTVAPIIKHVL